MFSCAAWSILSVQLCYYETLCNLACSGRWTYYAVLWLAHCVVLTDGRQHRRLAKF